MEEVGLLQGRYELRSVLGESEYAVTRLAEDRRTGQRCVVKSLPLRTVEDAKTVELFERESRVLANLEHPRIPRFLDAFTTDDGTVMHLVQSFVPGKDLARLVKEGRHFTEPQAVRLARDVAEILAYLHAFSPPIIHRDVKPTNVVLAPDGRAHLVDFGAARDKLLHDRESFGGGSTVVGTWGYMPYEQFSGRALPASDIYGLGATLLFCLSHKEPVEMDRGGRRLDFAPHVNVSDGFRDVLARMVEPDWEDRYASAGEVIAALDALEAEGEAARRPGAWTGPALVALAAGAVAGALLLNGRRAKSPLEAAPSALSAARTASVAARRPPPELSTGRPPAEEGPPAVAVEEEALPPVRPEGGVLRVDVYRDFKYQDTGWPLHLSVGQTEARGPDVRPFETLVAEPRYASSEVLYGYLLFGNGPDPRYTWVIDERDRPTWVVWFDRNNNEDLTDDGPPLPNQGTGKLAVDLALTVDVLRRTGEALRTPYHLWFWINEHPKDSEYLRPLSARFYARCHYAGRIELAGRLHAAVAYEESRHDALFADAGLFVDLDDNGRLDRTTEHFLDGERVWAGGESWTLSLDYP